MYQKNNLIILKFGSSVLRDESDLPRAVHEIYRWWRRGSQVLAVVSAFGNTTDQLISQAERICSSQEGAILAALLATGENAAAALLGLSIHRSGIPARILDPAQAGLRTVGKTLDSDLVGIDHTRLLAELRRAVVVLPGFVGKGEHGNTTLLGRGGSDLSALFLAHRLGGRCVLLKDVDGIYAADPATAAKRPVRFAELTYETAAKLGGNLVQPKAIRFAAAHGMPFTVTSIGSAHETVVGSPSDRLAVTTIESNPLRVALLGCGTVGTGVYQNLVKLDDLFTVIGVGIRNIESARAAGVPDEIITDSLEELLKGDYDVVVELIGGTKTAASFATRALTLGRHVVTANKALIANEGQRLTRLADQYGASLRYSAAVGAVMPALEAINQALSTGPVASFSGVLNGTTNFILDRLGEGQDFTSALKEAQEAGYAEANCVLDLNGTDSAHKLILLAREAFGASIQFDSINRTGIEEISPQWVRKTRTQGRSVRLIASCKRTPKGLKATVKPLVLPKTNPLASTCGTENCLHIQTESGASFVVKGNGAGCWPTSEAVIADLLDLRLEAQTLLERVAVEQEVCA
jgi:homoserine dehydrogenase